MFRTVFGLATILLACSGCTMCCHPYDYSGPVYGGSGCGSSCSSQRSRAGSILDGGVQDAQGTQTSMPVEKKVAKKVVRESAPATSARSKSRGKTASFASAGGRVPDRMRGEVKPGDVPGSERIVSVTERIVGSSTTTPADTAVAAQESPAESSTPLPTSGWTARRPETEVLR